MSITKNEESMLKFIDEATYNKPELIQYEDILENIIGTRVQVSQILQTLINRGMVQNFKMHGYTITGRGHIIAKHVKALEVF